MACYKSIFLLALIQLCILKTISAITQQERRAIRTMWSERKKFKEDYKLILAENAELKSELKQLKFDVKQIKNHEIKSIKDHSIQQIKELLAHELQNVKQDLEDVKLFVKNYNEENAIDDDLSELVLIDLDDSSLNIPESIYNNTSIANKPFGSSNNIKGKYVSMSAFNKFKEDTYAEIRNVNQTMEEFKEKTTKDIANSAFQVTDQVTDALFFLEEDIFSKLDDDYDEVIYCLVESDESQIVTTTETVPHAKPKKPRRKDFHPKVKKDDFSSAPECYEKLSHAGKKVFDMFTYFETQDEEQKLRLEAILEQFDAMHSGKF